MVWEAAESDVPMLRQVSALATAGSSDEGATVWAGVGAVVRPIVGSAAAIKRRNGSSTWTWPFAQRTTAAGCSGVPGVPVFSGNSVTFTKLSFFR